MVSRDVILSLCPNVRVTETAPAALTLQSPAVRVTVADLSPGLRDAWRVLASTGASEDTLLTRAGAPVDVISATLMRGYLRRCDDLGLLQYSVAAGHRPLLTVVPMVTGFYFSADTIDPAMPLRLSRFAYVRRLNDGLILESPLSTSRAMLTDRLATAIVATLAMARTCGEICAELEDSTAVDCAPMQSSLSLLHAAGFLARVEAGGRLAEDEDPALVSWEFHDLLFHGRSRLGRHNDAFGGVFPFKGVMEPLPAVARARSAETIRLHVPDLQRLRREDPSLTDVLERRASVRAHDSSPMTIDALGEFLFRTARVRRTAPASLDRPYESTSRPYPSGGGTYDLEIYVTVHACAGLASGLYHYDPANHHLERLDAPADCLAHLLQDAQHAAGLAAPPQILLTLASRFRRVSWKYRGMAYATTLKNVGVLLQTMYLAATAMDLAPCALGGGNSLVFARAAGTNEFEETSVGEFVLGRRTDG